MSQNTGEHWGDSAVYSKLGRAYSSSIVEVVGFVRTLTDASHLYCAKYIYTYILLRDFVNGENWKMIRMLYIQILARFNF